MFSVGTGVLNLGVSEGDTTVLDRGVGPNGKERTGCREGLVRGPLGLRIMIGNEGRLMDSACLWAPEILAGYPGFLSGFLTGRSPKNGYRTVYVQCISI